MSLLSNPWIVGIGTAVIAGLILHYIFGVGKIKSNKTSSSDKQEPFKILKGKNQEEYEIELQSFRNDMVRRGLAHSNIRLNGEAGLRKKFGIDLPTTKPNEIEIIINGIIYRLTNQNNGKYDKAKIDAGPNASPKEVLAHYDKLLGYIQHQDGSKIENGKFWNNERERLDKLEKRKKAWKRIGEITSHPVIAQGTIIILGAILWYIFGFNLSQLK